MDEKEEEVKGDVVDNWMLDKICMYSQTSWWQGKLPGKTYFSKDINYCHFLVTFFRRCYNLFLITV